LWTATAGCSLVLGTDCSECNINSQGRPCSAQGAATLRLNALAQAGGGRGAPPGQPLLVDDVGGFAVARPRSPWFRSGHYAPFTCTTAHVQFENPVHTQTSKGIGNKEVSFVLKGSCVLTVFWCSICFPCNEADTVSVAEQTLRLGNTPWQSMLNFPCPKEHNNFSQQFSIFHAQKQSTIFNISCPTLRTTFLIYFSIC
jgi:hypothetical protein